MREAVAARDGSIKEPPSPNLSPESPPSLTSVHLASRQPTQRLDHTQKTDELHVSDRHW